MPYLKSLPENAGPPNVFAQYPAIFGPFSEMSQALMNGPSSLTPAEREIILAYAAGVMGCEFVFVGHREVAYAWGVAPGTLERLLVDFDNAPVDARLKALLGFVGKLAATPNAVSQAELEVASAAGWDEQALQHAIAITARAAFMHRLVAGNGFAPLDPAVAARHARKRIEHGYVSVYKAFRKSE